MKNDIINKVKQSIIKDFTKSELKEINSFEDLQEKCDANMYFISVDVGGYEYNGTEKDNLFINDCIEEINDWLKTIH